MNGKGGGSSASDFLDQLRKQYERGFEDGRIAGMKIAPAKEDSQSGIKHFILDPYFGLFLGLLLGLFMGLFIGKVLSA